MPRTPTVTYRCQDCRLVRKGSAGHTTCERCGGNLTTVRYGRPAQRKR